MRTLIASGFLLLQLASIIYYKFTPAPVLLGSQRLVSWRAHADRWFPHGTVVEYTLQVTVNGRLLSLEEVRQRYHIGDDYKGGVFEQPAQNLIDWVQQYEETYGHNDRADVRLK